MFPHDMFKYGSMYCQPDRQALHNIYNACKAQGQLDWYAKQTSTAAWIKRLVSAYHNYSPRPKDGEKRKPFPLCRHMEEARCETGVLLDDMGEMMNKPTYIAHKAKAKYGGLGPIDAAAKWDDLEKDAEVFDFDADHPVYRTAIGAILTSHRILIRRPALCIPLPPA